MQQNSPDTYGHVASTFNNKILTHGHSLFEGVLYCTRDMDSARVIQGHSLVREEIAEIWYVVLFSSSKIRTLW